MVRDSTESASGRDCASPPLPDWRRRAYSPPMRYTLLLSLFGLPSILGAQAAVANADSQLVAPDILAEQLLVDVQSLDSTIRVDARYAGPNNFTGAPLPGYNANRALLRREAAEALARVQHRLASDGLGLKVWDGYRPVRATQAMVAWTERTNQTWLLDSGYIARRSRHNQGVAVDLTVVDLHSGVEMQMGTPYDTFGAEAHTANATGTVKQSRDHLVEVMASEGFTNYTMEWWHFSIVVEDPVPFDLVIRAAPHPPQ